MFMAGLHGWHVSIQLHTFGKLLWSKQFREASEIKLYSNPVVYFIIMKVLHLYSTTTSHFQCNYAVTVVITVQVIDQVLLVIEDNHNHIILEWN